MSSNRKQVEREVTSPVSPINQSRTPSKLGMSSKKKISTAMIQSTLSAKLKDSVVRK